MKKGKEKGRRKRYQFGAALAAFCLLQGALTASGAPAGGEERLAAGVGEILDVVPEADTYAGNETEKEVAGGEAKRKPLPTLPSRMSW